jgi:hypothetical protein
METKITWSNLWTRVVQQNQRDIIIDNEKKLALYMKENFNNEDNNDDNSGSEN